MNIKELIENADSAYYAAEYDVAIKIYHQILDFSPNNRHAKQQLEKALRYRSLRSATSDNLPTEALKLYQRSRSFIDAGDLAEAKSVLKRAIDIAKEAGVYFRIAQERLANIENSLSAAEYRKKSFEELRMQQWTKASGYLSSAINFDPTDDASKILLVHLQSLLKAQNLVQQLHSGAEGEINRSEIDKEIQEIINLTNETSALSVLWQEIVSRYQKGKSDFSIGMPVKLPDDTFIYDIFISYSHKDEEWVVNTLLPTLEKAGLKVCVDFRDFVPGKPSRHNMREACKKSAFTLLVITPAWLVSEWTEFESLLTFLHDPSGKRQRTIPILLKKCDLPEDIRIYTYIDFTRKDREDMEWKRLSKVLGVTADLKPK